jgi:hypothetical protein
MPLLFSPGYSPTHLLQLPSFLNYSLNGEWPSPISRGAFCTTATVISLPLSKHNGGGGATPAFFGWLVYLQFAWGSAPSPLSGAQGTPPSLLGVFFFFQLFFIIQFVFFSFFPGWGSVCPGGYVDLSQGCPWVYHVLLSSPGGLLASRIGAGIWQWGSPPDFSF